jgi:hypothetical protein
MNAVQSPSIVSRRSV